MSVTQSYTAEFSEPNASNEYPFFFEHIGSQAIEVYDMDSDGVPHELPASNFYTTFTGRRPIFDGGTVFVNEHVVENYVGMKIVRNTPIDQTVDWKTVERFPIKMVEFALDKITMILQELNDRLCTIEGAPGFTDPITQELEFNEYTTFPAEEVNYAINKLYLICIEMDLNKIANPDMPWAAGN